ncbi:MAG: hypothetical protein WCG27_06245 [Pseudomonadota bacterium]
MFQRVIILSLILLSLSTFAANQQIIAFNFDWDDNLMTLSTKLQLIDKNSGNIKFISSQEFALIRDQIGKTNTPYADYAMTPDTFRFFSDVPGRNVFLEDVEKFIRGHRKQAPSFRSFIDAMSTPQTAQYTTIITARGHNRESIFEGLKFLKEKGYIKFLPPLENIWPVTNPNFPEYFAKSFDGPYPYAPVGNQTSLAKAIIMEKILDQITKTQIPPTSATVLSPEGNSQGQYHLWGFSDDDYGNIEKAILNLQKGVDGGRWPNVKITLFFTGQNNPNIKPHAIVLRPNQAPRAYQETEEWMAILSEIKKLNFKD